MVLLQLKTFLEVKFISAQTPDLRAIHRRLFASLYYIVETRRVEWAFRSTALDFCFRKKVYNGNVMSQPTPVYNMINGKLLLQSSMWGFHFICGTLFLSLSAWSFFHTICATKCFFFHFQNKCYIHSKLYRLVTYTFTQTKAAGVQQI